MKKEETQIIKGLAILLMLFHHLFNSNGISPQVTTFFFIDDLPLVHVLSGAFNPINFFLICGGYGLYYVYKRGEDQHRYSRIFKLYIHYWLILLIFVTIAHFVSNSNLYPGNYVNIIYNITGLDTTWNAECWFLLPYVVLSMFSEFIFRIFDRFKIRYVVFSVFIIHLMRGGMLYICGSSEFLDNPFLNLLFLCLKFIFPFTIGAMMCRSNGFDKIRVIICNIHSCYRQIVLITSLLVLISIRCIINAWDPLYCLLFIIIILNLKRYPVIDKILIKLGRVSMEMWLIHSWYCYYLFRSEIYSLKYPIAIFLFLTIIT